MSAPDANAHSHPTERLLEAITRAQRTYEVGTDPGELFERMLTDLLALTDSEYGFIGEVLAGDDGLPYLKTHAITNIAWDEETRRFYEDNAPTGLVFTNLATLFGEVMVTGQAVLSNAPGDDPRRGGLPDGHPSLAAFLGAPFFHGGRFVGMVGIANRPGGYDEEILGWLQPLLTTCGGIIAVDRAWRQQEQVEEALREARDAAMAASDAKTRFLANMSHELRTPLNAIIGFSSLLRRRAQDEETGQLIERAHANGVHLLNIVNDILDVARIEQGGEEVVEAAEFCAVELTREVIGDLDGQLAAEVEVVVEASAEPLLVTTDRRRLRQVLLNLLGNAYKFTEQGSVRVALQADGDGGLEGIAIRDTGIGIAPADLARVFEPFQQADGSTSRRHGGTGLGLALSRSLAHLLGFELEVESEPARGSEFRLVRRRDDG